MTTTHNPPPRPNPPAIAGRGIRARLRAVGMRLSDRLHAGADDRARAVGWEVTRTPGRLGLTGRRYRDPRFAARQQAVQDPVPGRTGRHE